MSTTQTVNLTLPLGMSLDQAETFVHDRMTSPGDDDVINVNQCNSCTVVNAVQLHTIQIINCIDE